ncbi:hypothetical protein J2S43_002385 [Catenuloplanes nepalensis]|uniref:Uncharacterized protein n=1 Tax=Catenuloplanes nepalensis TaxID=587533 RepID=A0ABT9MR51_9ACTN|nr:hypothetical protein [Catenuloplanes nepalensis]MDP9793873.1 hypothetical protein [Catenuloplanes nepalensis]
MPTWHEIAEHARTAYTLVSDEEDGFALVWKYESGRTQQVSVTRFTYSEQDWAEFRSFVCKADEMAPRAALRKNADFAVGALATDSDGDYFLIHQAPLATLDPDEFALPLRALATTADALEKQHSERDDF